MANEISLNLGFSINNGLYKEQESFNGSFTQNTIGANAGVVVVATTITQLPFPQVTNFGWLYLLNLDATNYVDLGIDPTGAGTSMTSFGRLKTGEVAVFRLFPAVHFAMQANTASVKVQYLLLAD